MPSRILEPVFLDIRDPAAEVLGLLGPKLPSIVRCWRRSLRTLNLDRRGLRVLESLDIAQGLEHLRGISYSSLRSGLKQLGAELAAAGVQSEQALAAAYLLLDQCFPILAKNPAQAIVLTRLAGVLIAGLVAGYSAQWESGRSFLSDRLVDARRRLHSASAYVTQVYEMERRRLSHDLHDEIGHDLMLLKLYLEVMLRDLTIMDADSLRPRLEETLGVVQHAIDSTRRLVLDLGPAIFDELGFLPAIRSYVRQFMQRTKIQVELRAGPLPDQIPMSHQVALYRVLQGALGNVFKHAQATRVVVTLGRVRDGELYLVVEDNGVGFDVDAPRSEESVGLIAMRERIEVLGGSVRIASSTPGAISRRHGTRVEFGLPMPQTRTIASSRGRRPKSS